MNIKQLNESLQYYNEIIDLVDNLFPLNEMAIYYGTNHGETKDIIQAVNKLITIREGYIQTLQYLTVRQPVTDQDIALGLYNPIQKDVIVDKKFPIFVVWGEPDKTKGTSKLEGHGLVHILQGHEQQLKEVLSQLNKCIIENKPAKLDKNYNYTISFRQYRFCFKLCLEEPNMKPHAVLISAFKRV